MEERIEAILQARSHRKEKFEGALKVTREVLKVTEVLNEGVLKVT